MSKSRPGRTALAWILAPLALATGACAPEPYPVPGMPAPVAMTDANITSVTQAYNTGEVRIAQLAVNRSTNQAVRNFAQMMANDHNKANAQLSAIMSSQNIQASPINMTEEIKREEQRTMASLQNRSGADFDRAYLDAEIEHHRWLINQLDTNLIPGASDSMLRDHLSAVRATEAAHLQEAERLRASMGGN